MQEKDINKILARNLRRAIESRYGQISQKRFEEISGINQKTISNLLSPRLRLSTSTAAVPSPTLAKLQPLADALSMEPWQLIHPDGASAQASTIARAYDRLQTDAQRASIIASLRAFGVLD